MLKGKANAINLAVTEADCQRRIWNSVEHLQ